MEFARHAFLAAIVADMEAMDIPALSHNLSYAITHAMFYLVASSHRVQHLNKIEDAHLACATQESNLWHWIIELENDVHGFEK